MKDLNRFCYRSETCKIIIKELEFETKWGDNTGTYSTIEGVLEKIKGNLEKNFHWMGDSSVDGDK